MSRHWLLLLFLLTMLSFSTLALLSSSHSAVPVVVKPEGDLPELDEIEWVIEKPGDGVIFTVRDYDEEALIWLSERIDYYLYRIRKHHPKLPVALMAHGDELASLAVPIKPEYAELHTKIQSWIKDQHVTFHVCGTMAHRLGLSANQFPDYIDVVDYGPTQVLDYLAIGYTHIELELTW